MKRVNIFRALASAALLVIFFISITPLHAYVCSHHHQSQHHECCSCESHITDCTTHDSEVEQHCFGANPLKTEWIITSNKNTLRHKDSGSKTDDYKHLAITIQSAIITAILSLIHLTRPRGADSILSSFDPACRSLRAPPVLV